MTRLQYIKNTYGHGAQSMIARACGVSYQTSSRWMAQGYLPRTELLGTTHYAKAIERATHRAVTAGQLRDDIRRAIGVNATAA